ncbi:methylamine utilization protein MauJ [Paenibacillus peoriae]|uniref:methylamine utilization protein MauJ n=1 Tax=Paenibacillus peoriae TaxID=59893 RepID=UPI00096F9D38|nr:methylamine utilization protein MauJ [Paenibacillus peoriae]OMF40342.1 hypothetical protein BK135_23115 [Paenibacillus peoriae]
MDNYIIYSAKSVSLLQEGEFSIVPSATEISVMKVKTLNEPISDPKNAPKNGKVIISVYFSKGISFESAKKMGDKLADQFFNHFSYAKDIGLGRSEYIRSSFVESEIISRMEVNYSIISPIESSDIENVLESLENNNLNLNYMKLYRTALNNTDPIAEFMILYSILEFILPGRGQPKVCRFAMRHGYKKDHYNKSKKRQECLFTWLRNKIGHTDGDVDFEQVKTLMSQNNRKLAELTKSAIDKTSKL